MSDHFKPTRRQFLIGAGALAIGGAAGTVALRRTRARREPVVPAAGPVQNGTRRPNILLILSDQERNVLDLPADLSLPAHEKLMEQGVTFTQHHVNTSPCSPSRSNIYCGQHTQHTRMTANHGAPPFPELPDDMPTIGNLLRAQGYYTAYKGKWHLSHIPLDPGLVYGPYPSTRNALESYGFSDYNHDGDHHGSTWTGYKYDPEIASTAAYWLGTRGIDLKGRQPWFLAVNFVNPHDVMYISTGRKQSESRLRRDELSPLAGPPVGGVYDDYADRPMPPSHYRDNLAGKPWTHRTYVDICNMMYGRIEPGDEATWRTYQNYYFNCIKDMDSHVGTVLKALERLGLDDNTIIIYSSDHGEMAGAHGLRQKGPFMYRENMRVPLIVRHPDISGGWRTEALGSGIDLVPTILSFAGIDIARTRELYPYLKGCDLSAALTGSTKRTERDERGILFNYSSMLYIDPEFIRKYIASGVRMDRLYFLRMGLNTGQFIPSLKNPALFRGIHDGRYKFARYFRPAEHHAPKDWETLLKHNQLELYDTRSDPDEITNLAAEPDRYRGLIMDLNNRVNALIEKEVGRDDGEEHVGPTMLYRL